MLQRGKLLLWIHAFYFQYPVEAFRYGVVRRLVILCHRNGYTMFLQHGNIGVAAVLYAAVRVVNEACEHVAAAHRRSLVYGHLQGLHADCCFQRVGKRPSDDFAGVGVGNQMQVADIAVSKGYIGDIGHPQLIGFHGCKVLYQVLPFTVAVVRIGCVAGFRLG